jgi:hypothetical protein
MPPFWELPLAAFLFLLVGVYVSYRIYRAVRATALQRLSPGATLAGAERRLIGLFRWLVVESFCIAGGMSLADAGWLGATRPLTTWLSIVTLVVFPVGLILWAFTINRVRRVGSG